VQFRRLHQGLDQAFANLPRPSPPATSGTSVAPPAGFLAAFKPATIADRPAIVREHFDIAAVIKVNVSRGTNAGYDIKFDPKPPPGRLYYLTETAQVVHLEQLSNVVLMQDLETGQKSEMKLVEFVRHVQSGVWLLQPRPGASQGD
jgi:hypothetical protein